MSKKAIGKIERLSVEHLLEYVEPFLFEQIPSSKDIEKEDEKKADDKKEELEV